MRVVIFRVTINLLLKHVPNQVKIFHNMHVLPLIMIMIMECTSQKATLMFITTPQYGKNRLENLLANTSNS